MPESTLCLATSKHWCLNSAILTHRQSVLLLHLQRIGVHLCEHLKSPPQNQSFFLFPLNFPVTHFRSPFPPLLALCFLVGCSPPSVVLKQIFSTGKCERSEAEGWKSPSWNLLALLMGVRSAEGASCCPCHVQGLWDASDTSGAAFNLILLFFADVGI